jgi:CRISPR-associated protein Csd2
MKSSNVVELYSAQEPIFGMDPEKAVDRRVDIKFFFSVKNSNPQGDPDNENNPRVSEETEIGIMTPPGIKRHMRDALATIHKEAIFVSRNAVLARHVAAEALKVGIDLTGVVEEDEETDEEVEKKAKIERKAKKGVKLNDEQKKVVMDAVGKAFFDVRAFGQLFAKPINYSVRGPVQVSFAESVHKVEIAEYKIGRVAVTNEEEKAAGKNSMFGNLTVVPFGLYACEMCVSPSEAEKTGFTWGDLEKLVGVLPVMFNLSRSSTRFGLAFERAYVFLHSGKYGNVADHKLFRAVQATRKAPKNMEHQSEEQWPYPRSMEEFDIALDKAQVPAAVKVIVLD